MEQSERCRSAGGTTGKVKLKFKPVDAIEGIRALGGELPNMAQLPSSKGIIFFIHSAKRITLINPSADPPRSTLIGRYNNSTLRYTTPNAIGDSSQDHHVEVVRDHDGQLFFREQRQLLLPVEFFAKLLELVAV